jgi:hypothetical protein
MGVVYLATDRRDSSQVAVKVLRDIPGCEDELFRRLGVEARAQTRIRHPNVVEIREAELTASPPFLVMEFVQGRTLEQHLAEGGPWPADKAVRCILGLAGAVSALHESNILHRDLKPANIMIREDGQPVLMDLGLARLIDERTVTKTGALIGTPAYVPPEVLQGEAFSEAADQYQLAALLYEILMGQPLVDVKSLEDLLAGPGEDIPQRLDELEVRGQVRRALRRALRSNPKTRHASVEAFADSLMARSESHLQAVKEVDLTAEVTRSQAARADTRSRRSRSPGKTPLPPRLVQGMAAGVAFGVLVTAWLLSDGGPPEDVRWRVVADALLLDVVPGSSTGLQLELDGRVVEVHRQEGAGPVRMVYRGLEPEQERWARLRWDGGQGPRISVVGSGPALRREVELVEADAVQVEVVRPISVGWRGGGPPTPLGAGTAWLPLPPSTGELALEWVEDGVPFEVVLDLEDLLRRRIEKLMARVQDLDVPRRLEEVYLEGGGMDTELPALRREFGALASRIPRVLSGELAGVAPNQLWEVLNQVQCIAPTARLLGEVVPDMAFPRGAPGSRMYRRDAPAGTTPPLGVDGGKARRDERDHVFLTTSKGQLIPRSQNERAALALVFPWPSQFDGKAAVVWLRTRKLDAHSVFRLSAPDRAGSPGWRVDLWGDPRGTGGDPRFHGWMGFHVPRPLAPKAGTPLRVEFGRLVGESTEVGVVEDLRVSSPPSDRRSR